MSDPAMTLSEERQAALILALHNAHNAAMRDPMDAAAVVALVDKARALVDSDA